ncbi:hypothetical protein ACF3MZ_18150 [Paenibacillaceae bacterium WGS1546]|uniref:HTH domain-containing protein n=1 Tax=Cohnella sp. WGS1546 TaxID=3366810 RepID=UPI00372D6C35
MIEGILIGILGNSAYEIIKRLVKSYLPADDEELFQLLIQAIEAAAKQFHETHGDRYGTPSSGFLSIEKNWTIILHSIFYGTEMLNENQLVLTGLGISLSEGKAGAREFVGLLEEEMRQHFKLDEVLSKKKFMAETTEQLTMTTEKLTSIQNHLFDHLPPTKYPTTVIDQFIKIETTTIKKLRFYQKVDVIPDASILAERLITGDLSRGSDHVRRWALAWCARFAVTKEFEKAKGYLEQAKKLGACNDTVYAEAFIDAKKGEKSSGALASIAAINSPDARSVALKINTQHKDIRGITSWMRTVEYSYGDLDSEGKAYIISRFINDSFWDDIQEAADSITDDDFKETPVLYQLAAMSRLVVTVPLELRDVVVRQIPFNAAEFPLFDDTTSILMRREAYQHFCAAAEAARQLGLSDMAIINEEYALWLKLKDPRDADSGKKYLELKLDEPQSGLRLVPFALQFGAKLNLEAVEKEINREIALNGDVTQNAAIARLALAFTQKTPEKMALYIEQHFEELSGHIDRTSLQSLQVEMLSKAGLSKRAKECLASLLDEGISAIEESRLRRIIAESEGLDPVEARKLQFEETNSLNDLEALVQALESKEYWTYLCEYGEMLFDRTKTISDAERLARALTNTDETQRLVRVFKTHIDLLDRSNELRTMYCWALYSEGRLIEARSELTKCNDIDQNRNLRLLQVNLAISLGDWKSLSVFLANEIQMKDKRSALELLGSAQLALHLNLIYYAKELIYEAAARSNDDPQVLASAYFVAVNAGFEDEIEVSRWIHKAVELSGDDGPLQLVSLQEMLERKPEWERRESETWQLLSQGKIPLFLAAQTLNSSLINLMLFPAFSNQVESDFRRKGIVPAFSGALHPGELKDIKTVGIDATALLTLSFLNLLNTTFEAFDEIFIPHSTLMWLFEEQKQVAFHQPSRIENAKKIQRMLTTGSLEKLSPTTLVNSDLADQVGDELATLIAEATSTEKNGDNIQKVVVRPYPVPRVGSMMEENADLTEYSSVMSSCFSVVRKLREKGALTRAEEERAINYLHMHEEPWPFQPEISDNAALYLDDLSINYFQNLDILEKLTNSEFKVIISPKVITDVNELIRYESISDYIAETIESIRSSLSEGIFSGKVKVGRQRILDDQSKRFVKKPTVEVLSLASCCDAVISDDRFINQHSNINNGNSHTQVISTLDILDVLLSVGVITSEERTEYKTQLRRSGYIFMPLIEEELLSQLTASSVKGNKVVETAELKAIRESLLRIRMSSWLQLPKEAAWLNTIFQILNRVLRKLWETQPIQADHNSLIAYSDWILDQFDIRGWAHRLEREVGNHIVQTGRGSFILLLLLPPSGVSEEVRETYWEWIEERILIPIKEQYRELYHWLVEWQEAEIFERANINLPGEDGSRDLESAVILLAIQQIVPPMLQQSLLEKQTFREKFGLRGNAILDFNNSDFTVQRSELYDSIRRIYSDSTSEMSISDTKGEIWILKTYRKKDKVPQLIISQGKKNINLPDYSALSTDENIRSKSLISDALHLNFPDTALNKWRNILSVRALDDNEIDELHSDLSDTPKNIERLIRKEIMSGQANATNIVPSSRRYYERLVGCYDGSLSISEYAAGQAKMLSEQLSTWNSYDGLLLSLYLSSHAKLTDNINVDHLNNDDLLKVLGYLEETGDRISQIGAIEIGLRVLPDRPEIEPYVIRLIKQVTGDDIDSASSGFQLLSALFVLVDGELSRNRIFSQEPPFYRRLVSLSHAALIYRQIMSLNISIEKFSEWLLKHYSHHEQYYFQSLTDMRLEPRWNPDLAVASQLKSEFIGRIMMAAHRNKESIGQGELFDLLFGDRPDSIISLAKSPTVYFPGPLEGKGGSVSTLPPEIVEMIDTQLSAEEVSPKSFAALVNSALLFRININHADLAVQAIKTGNYRLVNLDNRSQLIAVLNGLALIAAVTRNNLLASELRILVRRYRNDLTWNLSVVEDMKICLVAAASYDDLNNWTDYVGEWLTEMAFGKLERDEGIRFLSHLQCLCQSVPELWVTCGKAEAALRAFNSK